MSAQDKDAGNVSRRRLFRGASVGVAGAVSAAAMPGIASAQSASPGAETEQADSTVHEGSVIAHLHDVRTGMVELIIDGEEKMVHSPKLARALARAARGH